MQLRPLPRAFPHASRLAHASALLAALFALPESRAQANTTLTWVGGADSNLLNSSNWSGGNVANSTALIFGAAGSSGTALSLGSGLNAGYTITPAQLPAVDFTTSAPAYVISGAGQLTFATGGLRNQSGQTQTFNNPVRFNTGSTHQLSNANSALVFGNTATLNSATTTFSLGGAAGHAVTFNGNLAAGNVTHALVLNGSGNSSVVNINGAANTGLSALTIGQNVRVNLGSATGLGSAATVTLNGAGAVLANASGSPLATNASLSFNATSQAYFFGDAAHTAANNMAFNGSAAINADQTRTLTLNGSGVTVSSASVWNNTVTGGRSLTVNGAGNTFGIGGLAIGASGETAGVTLTLAGTAGVTVSGGITNGQGSGTRSLQVNSGAVVAVNGASDYSGVTGVGGSATLLVNGTHSGGGVYTVQGVLGGTGVIDLSAANAGVAFASTGNNRRLVASSADGLAIIGGSSAALNLVNAAGRVDGFQSFYFTLGAPGGTVVDVQGLLNLGSGTLNFDDFVFAAGPGFGAGVYRLFDYTSVSGTLGPALSGQIGGLDALISSDAVNGAVILTVSAIPEPSSFAALAGLGAAGLAAARRRR